MLPPELPLDRSALRDHLRARLDHGEPTDRQAPPGRSAVLVPVALRDEPVVVFTRRTDHLSSHPGEVSFPGGRMDDGDQGPLDTALRETEEEVGLAPEHLEVLGHLTEYQPYRGPLISTYVALLAPDAPAPRRASPREVAEVLEVPLRTLLRPQEPPPDTPRGGWWVDDYESRVWHDPDKGPRQVHYWHLDQETIIWGITGELVHRFLVQCFGWEPPAGPVLIDGIEQFWKHHRPTGG